ncbi:phosphotransferase [Actinopolymorpha sp. B11F2]|uniref:phosphotransferase n=1 Tax=Actinopolymorpha sp. B11F2 TaxID=3160862 RepID=UPI0032E44DD7
MDEISGAQRDILGATTTGQVADWVARHVRDHIGSGVDAVLFTGGDIGAVFGLRLSDGRDVVLKAFRPGANVQRLQAVVRAQNTLAAAGFGCARVFDGPSSTGDVLALVEERLACASTGSPHDQAARVAMAAALAGQIDALRDMDGAALVPGRPAWADWSVGTWPAPHHPAFDFSTPVPGMEWVEETADAAAMVLRAADHSRPVIGHSDWVWQNVCVVDGAFVAGYDWDSLVYAPEPAVVGLCAGAFTQGTPVPPDAPTAAEVAAFLDDYERFRPFSRAERRTADAAATWVRCYNARCQLDNLHRRSLDPPPGSFVETLRGAGLGGKTDDVADSR